MKKTIENPVAINDELILTPGDEIEIHSAETTENTEPVDESVKSGETEQASSLEERIAFLKKKD